MYYLSFLNISCYIVPSLVTNIVPLKSDSMHMGDEPQKQNEIFLGIISWHSETASGDAHRVSAEGLASEEREQP